MAALVKNPRYNNSSTSLGLVYIPFVYSVCAAVGGVCRCALRTRRDLGLVSFILEAKWALGIPELPRESPELPRGIPGAVLRCLKNRNAIQSSLAIQPRYNTLVITMPSSILVKASCYNRVQRCTRQKLDESAT